MREVMRVGYLHRRKFNFNMLTNFQQQTLIGSGSFGNVYKAKWNKKPVAVKILHDYLFHWHDPRGIVDKFQDECRILQRLKHKNVVRLVEFVISHSSPPMLITELLECDLGKYIGQCQQNKIPFPETVSIMLDVAEGLVYLHHECNPSIVHRDLASKNVLLTKEKQAKIADLGLAKCFSREQRMLASPVPGTPTYAAPETYPTNPASSKAEYGVKIDIFSFGVMLMEVINGSYPEMEPDSPFESDGRRIPEKERRRDDISKMGEHRLRGIVLRCIEDDSDERASAEEVADSLQKEKSKIEQKKAIARRGKPHRPPKLKIVPLGESGTGKTCIIKRFNDNSFTEVEPDTIGQDIYERNITLHGKDYCLQVFDTAGQEIFHSIPQTFLRGADGVLLVFDVTKRESFEKKEDGGVPAMLQFVNDYKTDYTSVILVGNKVDAKDHKISRVEAEEYARKLGVRYFETSAKTGHNIEAVFEEIARDIYDALDLSDIGTYVSGAGNKIIHLTEDVPRESNNCSCC